MTPPARQPLRIEAHHDDRVILLGCDTCATTDELHTGDSLFATSVQAFFERHVGCSSSIDLA